MQVEIVDDDGRGDAVVYLPGIGGTGVMAALCLERLRADFRAIRLAYVAAGEDSYPALAASVLAALDRAGLERAVLLAESFGVGVALHAALAAPERVAGLALVNGFARHPAPTRLRLGRIAAACGGGRAYRWVRRRVGVDRLLGPRSTPALVERLLAHQPQFGAGQRARLGMIAELDLRDRLARIDVPVTLFASDSDRIVPAVSCARELAAGLVDAELRVLEDAGHLVLPVAAFDWPGWLAALWARVHARHAATALSQGTR